MKRLLTILAVACLAMIVIALLLARPAPATPQGIRFVGFTNSVVGVVSPVFASLATNNAASIQRWLGAGTNGAIFTITNQQSCAIWVFPLGRMCTDEAAPMRDETPLLTRQRFRGFGCHPDRSLIFK